MSLSETADAPAGLTAKARSRAGWASLLLVVAAAAAVLSGVGLALLWLARNPLITGWDYLSHANAAIADAALVRAHDWGEARDQFFLLNRFEPPGLRLLGAPLALLFWPSALTALRLSATVCFVLTGGVLFAGLRRIAGTAGAAVAVLAYALAPVNISGAQNFMTEQVLLPCAGVVIAALAAELGAAEARPSARGVVRLGVLGLALGWGTLTKLTFLPTMVVPWVGVAAWLWWRRRDARRAAAAAGAARRAAAVRGLAGLCAEPAALPRLCARDRRRVRVRGLAGAGVGVRAAAGRVAGRRRDSGRPGRWCWWRARRCWRCAGAGSRRRRACWRRCAWSRACPRWPPIVSRATRPTAIWRWIRCCSARRRGSGSGRRCAGRCRWRAPSLRWCCSARRRSLAPPGRSRSAHRRPARCCRGWPMPARGRTTPAITACWRG